MNDNKAPGSTLLLIAGIFYVIIGSLFLLIGLPLTACVAVLEPLTEYEPVAETLLFTVLIGGAFSLVIGILGISHRNNIQKAKMLFRIGVAVLIIDLIVLWQLHQVTTVTILFLPLPVIYIIGALKNKKATQNDVAWDTKLAKVKHDAEMARIKAGWRPKNPELYENDEYLRKHKLEPLPETSKEGAHYNSNRWSTNPNMLAGKEYALFNNENKVEKTD